MEKFIAVFSTVPDRETGINIANALVRGKYAACVNIIPGVTSIYEWENTVYNEEELLLFVKTRSSLFDEVKKKISEVHPYEVPEIISFEIKDGHAPYLRWISEVTARE